MKAVQKLSDVYLERCQDMTADQIIQFLDDFRNLHSSKTASSKLISIKIPTHLLNTFKAKSAMANTPYQTKIKILMKAWVLKSSGD
jgi:predicted DNA binding CopG/RHH family protein